MQVELSCNAAHTQCDLMPCLLSNQAHGQRFLYAHNLTGFFLFYGFSNCFFNYATCGKREYGRGRERAGLPFCLASKVNTFWQLNLRPIYISITIKTHLKRGKTFPTLTHTCHRQVEMWWQARTSFPTRYEFSPSSSLYLSLKNLHA